MAIYGRDTRAAAIGAVFKNELTSRTAILRFYGNCGTLEWKRFPREGNSITGNPVEDSC